MYTITLQGLPPTLNTWLSGTHWRTKNAQKHEWDLIFLAAFREAKLPKPLKWPLTLSVTQYCKGVVRDADNAVIAAKFAGDTLVKHGWLPDDSPECIPTVILATKKGKENKTVLCIL